MATFDSQGGIVSGDVGLNPLTGDYATQTFASPGTELFSSVAGMVAIMTIKGALPGNISLDGFKPVAAIVHGFQTQQQTNQQFNTSLNDAVYMYVFGDQIGQVEINGYTFAGMCDSNASGLEEVMQYYQQNRAAKRATPLRVVVGNTPIDGYLTLLAVLSSDTERRINQFTLRLSTIPDDTRGSGGSSGYSAADFASAYPGAV